MNAVFTVLLFQSRFKTSFERFITPGALIDAILFFSCITIALVTFTYLYLGLKKQAFFFRERIKKSLELWISSVILSDDPEENIRIPEKFNKIFEKSIARQYAIEHLIINKKTFAGAVGDNIRLLYEQLGFKEDSLRKLKSKLWYIRAKGIQELALMDQSDQLIKVYRLTNSRNELVRNEAQAAIIHWSGFNGLRFLDVAAYDISEWQQVQLLVQLRNFTQQDMPKLHKWLSSSNDTVVIFALKLAEVYQQFQVKENVEACLSHANESVRIHAINTLAVIGDEGSADKMVAQYLQEDFANRINILNRMAAISSPAQLPFLLSELDNSNDFLKLAAARAIAKTGHSSLLQEKAASQPEPYRQIYQHVKAETAF